MAVAISGALESAPSVAPELSVCRAWRLRGRAADLLSSGQERPCCPGPSRPLPVPGGRPDPGLCPGTQCSGACAVGFVLPPRSPLRGAAPGSRRPRCSP